MKAKQSEHKFAPITIILETEEEAELMWHKLNLSHDILKFQTERWDYKLPNNSRSISQEMWEVFNVAFQQIKK